MTPDIRDLVERLRTHARVVGQAAVESGNVVEAAIAADCSQAANAIEYLDELRQHPITGWRVLPLAPRGGGV